MGWHSEKQFSNLSRSEQQKEREKVNNGYNSEYFSDIIKERVPEVKNDKKIKSYK